MPKKSLSFILAAAVAGVVAPLAQASEPTYEELQQQVRQLQGEVDSLRGGQEVNSIATDRVIDDVLREADRRTQLLANDTRLTAGYDRGFYIGSEDGNFTLKPGVNAQFRYVAAFTDSDGEDDSGFELRRFRPTLSGNLYSPKFTYNVQFDVNRSGGAVTLLDAFVQYKFADDWGVKLGQFKESVFRERDVGGFRQLAVDMSIADSLLGGAATDRVQGVALVYGSSKNPLRAELAFHDGANSKNTNFQDGNSNFGVGGRVEYKFSGAWADYRDFTAKGVKDEALLVVGAGADWTQSGDTDIYRTTADVQWELPGGLSLFGAIHGNFTENGGSRQDYGAVAQVGYLFTPAWEVFGRYAIVAFDDDFVAGEDTYNEIVAGVNYYFGPDGSYGQRAKLTVDAAYLPDGAPSGLGGLGYNASEEDEFVFRAQLTLVL